MAGDGSIKTVINMQPEQEEQGTCAITFAIYSEVGKALQMNLNKTGQPGIR